MIKVREKLKKGLRLVAIVCRQEGDFLLNYYFDSKGKVETLTFKVPKDDTKVESITEEYPSADYYEREIHDFFGVEFVGNLNLHLKLFLPDNWKGKPPMLKDDKNA
ncbi:MAG: NADH-quinone oxidoreductase subunit C [Candidatus Aenigmatarchaeota archaeon]